MDYRREDYYGPPQEDESDCREDKWAKILLAGKSIEVYDYYAEGCVYGNLPHTVGEEDAEYVHYTVTLKDVEEGLARAINSKSWVAQYALELSEKPENIDLSIGEALMQYILFGEEIYG